MKRRVVCAAIRDADGDIICSARHFDALMRSQIRLSNKTWITAEQGFIDQRGEFLNRKDARMVAFEANQIIHRCGGDTKELFSENIY